MMKRAATAVFALFWAAMIFFTAFGDRLYYAFKPRVKVDEVISFDGGAYLPKSAVFEEADGDYVYALKSEAGFSRVIYTVIREKIIGYSPDDSGYFDGWVKIEAEGGLRGVFVISSSKPLFDGAKVIWEGEI